MKIGIIAIHGGRIEPGTDDIAIALAGDTYPVYINTKGPHVTSAEYDTERIRDFLSEVDVVVSIHGEAEKEDAFTMVGGLDLDLAKKIEESLNGSGFKTKIPDNDLRGTDPKNVCNRALSGRGVQLEISRLQRDEILGNKEAFDKYIKAIKIAL